MQRQEAAQAAVDIKQVVTALLFQLTVVEEEEVLLQQYSLQIPI